MSEKFYKKMYTVGELYVILYNAIRTVRYTKKSQANGEISQQFFERIMLAVTEVNGCEVCSYYHAEEALKSGMSEDEINTMLSGNTDSIPKDESIAIFFAQHYADKKGNPNKQAWQKVIDTYGDAKSYGILGVIRMIMFGNASGIALSAFKSRLKGNKIDNSNLGYELSMMLVIIPFLPIAIIHSFASRILNRPLIKFENL